MSDSSELSLHDGSNKTNSLPDEFAAILERGESEGEETTKSEECLCSFFDQERIANPTLEEYKLRQLKEAPLFANVLTSDKDEGQVCIERPSENDDTSILVTGFGIRNLESLQDVLEVDARRR